MPTPADTTKHITHSRGFTVTTTTVTTPPKPKDDFDLMGILTLVIPVLTFAAGYFITNYFDKRKERNRLKDVKEYFLALAEALVKAIQAQSMSLLDAASRFQNLKGNNFSINIFSDLNTERIKAIPNLDLYKIFVSNAKDIKVRVYNLNTLSAILDTISAIDALIVNHNDKIASVTETYAGVYNEKINDILRKKDDLIAKIKADDALPSTTNKNVLDRPNAIRLINGIAAIFDAHKSPNPDGFNDILDIYTKIGKNLYDLSESKYITKNEDTLPILVSISEAHHIHLSFVNKMNTIGNDNIKRNDKLLNTSVALTTIITELRS